MGIKNIHIALISASILISVVLGTWSLIHNYVVLGCIALASAGALLAYCINFIKKMRVS